MGSQRLRGERIILRMRQIEFYKRGPGPGAGGPGGLGDREGHHPARGEEEDGDTQERGVDPHRHRWGGRPCRGQ